MKLFISKHKTDKNIGIGLYYYFNVCLNIGELYLLLTSSIAICFCIEIYEKCLAYHRYIAEKERSILILLSDNWIFFSDNTPKLDK